MRRGNGMGRAAKRRKEGEVSERGQLRSPFQNRVWQTMHDSHFPLPMASNSTYRRYFIPPPPRALR